MTHQNERHCLITGGAGFIGSHLAEALLKEGCAVTVVDNLATGRQANLAKALSHPNFRFVKLDVANRELMAPLVAQSTEVYHLASYVGVRLAAYPSSSHILNNLRAIDNILDLVTHYRTKFQLSSTSEVYGKAMDVRSGHIENLKEDADRIYGSTNIHRWSYSGIKAIEEFLTLAKYHEEGIYAVIVRLFNVVGPRQIGQNGMVIPRFIQQALQGEAITVYGDGAQQRCFSYIGDVVRCMIDLMKTPGASGEIFNIGNDIPVSILELAHKIKELTGSRSEIVFVPIEKAFGTSFEDVLLRVPNVDKLSKQLGYHPTTGLDRILMELIEEAQKTIYPYSVRH
ncbi:MAG: SDR family NAD(P)-dependent oxidoreductase [Bacteroidetes Order II. Incertae sedis bacterium]|nr:SDR family NAD(P)-dependent oxidoreductase [Bacteroidetes Order II. bacterium]